MRVMYQRDLAGEGLGLPREERGDMPKALQEPTKMARQEQECAGTEGAGLEWHRWEIGSTRSSPQGSTCCNTDLPAGLAKPSRNSANMLPA